MPSSARALARGPASSARPEVSCSATSSARIFASTSSPQTNASSSGGSDEPRVDALRANAVPRERGRRARAWMRSASERASRVGRTPDEVKRSSEATQSTGTEPIASRRSPAVSRAASAFVARTTRSAVPTASAFVAPSTPSSVAASFGPCCVPRAEHDLVRLAEARRERGSEGPRAADDRYPHAASRTRSARRRAASRSDMSVWVTTSSTSRYGRSVRLVDDECIDQTRVTVCYMGRCGAARHAREHTVERARDGLASDERAHGDTWDAA